MRLIITIGLILISTVAFAQTYEKASDSVLKVTQAVSTDYDITKIKERLVDLADYIKVAEAQIITYNQQIAELNKLLDEAVKVGIDTNKVSEVVTP